MSSSFRRFVVGFVPIKLRHAIRRARMSRENAKFETMGRRDTFTRIYAEGLWGQTANDDFDSGSGSREAHIVDPYVSSVVSFLQRLGAPDVVDLGCGDFAVGAKIRPFCDNYTACDIVETLIERNRVRFANDKVDFRVLDIVTEPLPRAKVATLRQVLQHLSNADILEVLSKLEVSYQYLVVTEHLPVEGTYTPNLDKNTGPGIRLVANKTSGVVLTESPFNLNPKSVEIICEVDPRDENTRGVIRTTVYEM